MSEEENSIANEETPIARYSLEDMQQPHQFLEIIATFGGEHQDPYGSMAQLNSIKTENGSIRTSDVYGEKVLLFYPASRTKEDVGELTGIIRDLENRGFFVKPIDLRDTWELLMDD